jgi:hypothetical protein
VDPFLLKLSLGSSCAIALGVVPRLGPGRSFSLALRPLFKFGTKHSQRVHDKMKFEIAAKSIDSDKFLVVCGPKGVGTSTMIQDVFRWHLGVVNVTVPPGCAQSEIENMVHLAVSNLYDFKLVNPRRNSLRVLFWYRLLFWKSPIIVLGGQERASSSTTLSFSDIPGAARSLAASGFRVVVDASHNSLHPLLRTMREEVVFLSELDDQVSLTFVLLLS